MYMKVFIITESKPCTKDNISLKLNKYINMKKLISPLILVFLLLLAEGMVAQELVLVKNNTANSTIVIPQNASVIEIQAAKVFQDYIQRISGALIAIKSDETKPLKGEILIGNVSRSEIKNVPFDRLGEDGFLIKNTGERLVISGGTEKGVLYGVYTFLEKYMGCRKYSSKVTYVPKQNTIILKPIDDLETPAFTYREDYYPDAYDPEYMYWHKLDSHFEGVDRGNKWGSWVHTFNRLLSSTEYGESHPEYFSFYDGKRHSGINANGRDGTQLCLSNPEVLEIVCKNLQSLITQNPQALYWSVSQNDNVNYCRCSKCAELDSKYAAYAPGTIMYGTHDNVKNYSPLGMGSLLTFVNKVAERFPDKIISTLAYQYTRVPPKDIIPRKNVNIMLCSIESPRNVTLQEGDTAFHRDLLGWTKLTKNIIIWDYVVQFWNLVSPFPNLRTLQPNLQFLHNNGIPLIFEQGSPETGGEFAELRAYMIAKSLWNPDLDINEVTDDFLSGYYGNASKEIRQYIDLLHNQMEKFGDKLLIFGSPVDAKETYLSDSLITVYNQLFDKAENAVRQSPQVLKRVQIARIPIYYSILEIAKAEKTGNRGAFIKVGNTLKPNPEIVNILHDFVYRCIKTNVSHVRERKITPQQYLETYTKFLTEPSNVNKLASIN